MLIIIVILFVAFILKPLIELVTAEKARYLLSLIVYLLAAIWILYQLVLVGAR
jgi:hypothetical protein